MSERNTITADELIHFLADDSFNKPLLRLANEDDWSRARETVSRLLPTVLPEINAQSHWNVMQDVCRRVDAMLRASPSEEVQRVVRDPAVREIRSRLGLRVAVRLRLARHGDFDHFVDFIRHNWRETGSLMANYAGRHKERAKAISGVMYGILRDYNAEGESPEVFWKVLTEYLTSESGVKVERVINLHSKEKIGMLCVAGMSN